MGHVSRCRYGVDSHGRCIRSRRAPSRLHAIPARRPCRRNGLGDYTPLGACADRGTPDRLVSSDRSPRICARRSLSRHSEASSEKPTFPGGSHARADERRCVLHGAGLIEIQLPHWLLASCYALLGWMVGLSFSREILTHALRSLPQIVLSIFALISFCAALAFVLVKILGVDPLTAYLATSPGGLDSVAIIAASAKVDLSFVMALQTVRFFDCARDRTHHLAFRRTPIGAGDRATAL